MKSFRREQTAENGLGCDVGGFYCFLGVLRKNQRGILEFGLASGEFWLDYIFFGVEKTGAVVDKNIQSHIVM